MHAPQIIIVCFYVMTITANIVKKDGIGFTAAVIAAASNAGILYWGGFWG